MTRPAPHRDVVARIARHLAVAAERRKLAASEAEDELARIREGNRPQTDSRSAPILLDAADDSARAARVVAEVVDRLAPLDRRTTKTRASRAVAFDASQFAQVCAKNARADWRGDTDASR